MENTDLDKCVICTLVSRDCVPFWKCRKVMCTLDTRVHITNLTISKILMLQRLQNYIWHFFISLYSFSQFLKTGSTTLKYPYLHLFLEMFFHKIPGSYVITVISQFKSFFCIVYRTLFHQCNSENSTEQFILLLKDYFQTEIV